MNDKQRTAQMHFERAMQSATPRSRAMSLYNALGTLSGFAGVEEALEPFMKEESLARYMNYVLSIANEGDRQDSYEPAQITNSDLTDVVRALVHTLHGDC